MNGQWHQHVKIRLFMCFGSHSCSGSHSSSGNLFPIFPLRIAEFTFSISEKHYLTILGHLLTIHPSRLQEEQVYISCLSPLHSVTSQSIPPLQLFSLKIMQTSYLLFLLDSFQYLPSLTSLQWIIVFLSFILETPALGSQSHSVCAVLSLCSWLSPVHSC